MQTKSAKPKNERPAAGQKRSATATKKSRVASENGLMQAATLTTGLLAENGDLTPTETAPTEIATTEAVPAQDTTAIADPNAATIEGEASTESPASLDMVPAGEIQEEATEFIPSVEAAPTAADLPAPPVVAAVSDAALPTARVGLVQSPLAARMLAEAAERRAGKSGRASRAVDHSLREEFMQADALVKSLKSQLNAARSRVQGNADASVAAQITALRSQIRASRGSKIEGVAPFDAAIATAREALSVAKAAKREFLADQGIGVSTATGGLSPRQQLNALRSQIRESANAADSAELTQLRAAYRQAKSNRQAAREKALAPLPTAAESGAREQEAHDADSEPMNDAPTGENADNINDDINDDVADDTNGEEVPDADNAAAEVAV